MKIFVGDVVSLTNDRYGEVMEYSANERKILIQSIVHPDDEDETILYWAPVEEVESIR